MQNSTWNGNTFLRPLYLTTAGRIGALLSSSAVVAQLLTFFFPNLPDIVRVVSLYLGIVFIVGTLVWLTLRFLREQQSTITDLQSQLKVARFPTKASREDFSNFGSDADSLFVFGITLSTLIAQHRVMLEKLRASGCQFRFLLPDLDKLLNAINALSMNWPTQRALIDEYRNCMGWLANQAKQSGGDFRIRTTSVVPTISLLIVNPDSPNGQLRISLHLYRGSHETRPFLEIKRQDSPEWYKFFYDLYYVDLWNKSDDYVPGPKGELDRARKRIQ